MVCCVCSYGDITPTTTLSYCLFPLVLVMILLIIPPRLSAVLEKFGVSPLPASSELCMHGSAACY